MCPLSQPIEELDDKESKALLDSGKFPETPIDATLIGDKIIVFNPVHGSLLYGYGRFFGTPVGIRKPKTHLFNRPLELTFFEAYYLLKYNKISIYRDSPTEPLSLSEFFEFACDFYPNFEEKYKIYEQLRDYKYVPRPGQKFGADFIIYKQGPGVDHSSFCIQVFSRKTRIYSLDVVKAGRLATSVKKKFVLANPITNTYFQFKWFKP